MNERLPDPIERGEARAEAWEHELNYNGRTGMIDCCECRKRVSINDTVTMSPDPWAPPMCQDCAERLYPGVFGA